MERLTEQQENFLILCEPNDIMSPEGPATSTVSSFLQARRFFFLGLFVFSFRGYGLFFGGNFGGSLIITIKQ